MGEPEQEALRGLIEAAVELCTDTALLDLIYKLLTSISL